MPTLLETTAGFLQSEGMDFDTVLENGELLGSIKAYNATLPWNVYVIESEELNSVSAYANLPSYIPEARRPAVAELLTRINSRMGNSHFELDFADGVAQCGIVVDIMDGILTRTMFMRMFKLSLQTCDNYFPTIMGVVYGGTSPAMALEMLDNAGEAIH